MKFLKSFCLFLFLFNFPAKASPNFSVGEKIELSEDDTWELLIDNKKVNLSLNSIGGEPNILKVEERLSPAKEKFWIIYYDAGTAGTSTLSQVDRYMVVNSKGEEFKVLLDKEIRLVRFQGLKILNKVKRDIKWSPDNQKLKLGDFENESAQVYSWKNLGLEEEK